MIKPSEIPRERLIPLYPMDGVVDEIVKYLLEISGSDRSLGNELDDADREEIRVSMIKGAYELYLLRLGLWNDFSFELGKLNEGKRSQFFFSLDRDAGVLPQPHG